LPFRRVELNWKFWRLRINLRGKGGKYLRYLYLLGILVLFSIGGAIAYLGNNTKNPALILIGFAGLAGSFMLFLWWRNMGQVRILAEQGEEGEAGAAPPNSLVIYPDRIAFAYIENAPGQTQKCFNDGKFYHVLCPGEKEGQFQEFTLPDDDEKERYFDPQEFANPVTMPSNKKYFTWSASTMQKISVGIMALVIVGLIIGLVAMGG